MRIEILAAIHDRNRFDCGSEELNRFLRQFANQNSKAYLSKTFVATEDGIRICGYFTLAASALERSEFPAARLPMYPTPTAVVARLTVDQEYQGCGLGRTLLFAALRRIAESAQGNLPLYAVVVDAISPDAAPFYAQYGFKPLNSDNPLHLYLPIKQLLHSPLVTGNR